VIGSRVGGVPEMISPESGDLFESGNPADLMAKLQGLIDDPQRRAAIGLAAAQRAAQDFSMERVAERMGGLYAALAAGR
jgi:glycosyltransferase involved in cell wall biosynthesis